MNHQTTYHKIKFSPLSAYPLPGSKALQPSKQLVGFLCWAKAGREKMRKMTLKKKRAMYKGTFNPKSQSKYAIKKQRQARGIFSPLSPFMAVEPAIGESTVEL